MHMPAVTRANGEPNTKTEVVLIERCVFVCIYKKSSTSTHSEPFSSLSCVQTFIHPETTGLIGPLTFMVRAVRGKRCTNK